MGNKKTQKTRPSVPAKLNAEELAYLTAVERNTELAAFLQKELDMARTEKGLPPKQIEPQSPIEFPAESTLTSWPMRRRQLQEEARLWMKKPKTAGIGQFLLELLKATGTAIAAGDIKKTAILAFYLGAQEERGRIYPSLLRWVRGRKRRTENKKNNYREIIAEVKAVLEKNLLKNPKYSKTSAMAAVERKAKAAAKSKTTCRSESTIKRAIGKMKKEDILKFK